MENLEFNHFSFTETPVQKLDFYSEKYSAEVYVKRDDLFPAGGGGNKARMLQYILHDSLTLKYNTVVTAGGPASNFNRAMAMMCRKLHLNLKLITYTNCISDYNSDNAYLLSLLDTEFIKCQKSSVKETIDKYCSSLQKASIKYKFVYGGGKSQEAFYAFYKAVEYLQKQMDIPDAIFIACGTGTTLTGISTACNCFFPKTHIYAISIARTKETGFAILQENIKQINESNKHAFDLNNIRLLDCYLNGGYGDSCSKENSIIKEAAREDGLILDPIYTGKAFWGMDDIIMSNRNKFKGKKILFWHTGGVFNLLSNKVPLT
jgi:D-cysteine desulfhydrase